MTALATLLNAAMADGAKRRRRKKGRKAAGRRKVAVKKHLHSDAALFAALGLDSARRRRKKPHADVMRGSFTTKKRADAGKKRKTTKAKCSKELVSVFNKFCKYEQELKKKEAQAKAAEEFRKTAAKISSWTNPEFIDTARVRRRRVKRKTAKRGARR